MSVVEHVEQADKLLRDDAEQLRREHPDLVKQLREYEDDWREFLDVLGRTESASPKDAVARQTRRRAFHRA